MARLFTKAYADRLLKQVEPLYATEGNYYYRMYDVDAPPMVGAIRSSNPSTMNKKWFYTAMVILAELKPVAFFLEQNDQRLKLAFIKADSFVELEIDNTFSLHDYRQTWSDKWLRYPVSPALLKML